MAESWVSVGTLDSHGQAYEAVRLFLEQKATHERYEFPERSE